MGAIPIYNQNLIEMEKDKLTEEMCFEGRNLYNILNFRDFILEEGKKDKKESKKSRPIIKKRGEFINDMEDDVIDPNETPERFIKLREEFIREEYQ